MSKKIPSVNSSGSQISTYTWNKIGEVKKFIDDGNSYPTIKIISQQFCMSKSLLIKAFGFRYNISIHKYIIQLKMDKAKKLLADGTLTISDIAETLGYSAYSNFSRDFKKYTGLLPQVYRKNAFFE